VHATVRLGTAHRPGAGLLRLRKAGEPRLDSSQYAHKAARLQELPAPAATGRHASCDPKVEDMGQRPDDPVDLYIHSLNDAIAAAGVHLCRGNFKGHYLGSGGCESSPSDSPATTTPTISS
jgi:hypothetical protein